MIRSSSSTEKTNTGSTTRRARVARTCLAATAIGAAPIWFPINYLLIEALERYGGFYGDDFMVECPTRSGNWITLQQVADELAHRLTKLFVRGEDGRCAFAGEDDRFRDDPHYRDLVWFYEYFDGDHRSRLRCVPPNRLDCVGRALLWSANVDRF